MKKGPPSTGAGEGDKWKIPLERFGSRGKRKQLKGKSFGTVKSEEQATKENDKRGRPIWDLIKREICAWQRERSRHFL